MDGILARLFGPPARGVSPPPTYHPLEASPLSRVAAEFERWERSENRLRRRRRRESWLASYGVGTPQPADRGAEVG